MWFLDKRIQVICDELKKINYGKEHANGTHSL